MSWKCRHFTRRARELAAEHNGEGRAYLPIDEVEEGGPYGLHYIWTCLSKAWSAGRAMSKPLQTLNDEAEAWLSEIGMKHCKAIGQAFVETKMEPRIQNIRFELSRFEMTTTASTSNMSAQEEERRVMELQNWHTDLVEECAEIFATKSMPDANHLLLDWQEQDAILPGLWSLYTRGPRASEDRKTLTTLAMEIAGASKEQAEMWIREREGGVENN